MGVSQNRTLQRSVWSLTSIYYLVEAVVFFVIARIYAFSLVFFLVFLGVQTVFCAAVGLFLIIYKSFFYYIKTGEALFSINLPCGITLFRITMIPSVIFLIIALKSYPVGAVLALFIGLTCVSDLFDGYISRRCNEETFIGKIMDSVSDYLLLGVVAIAYYIYRLLPVWLFWLIISRILLHSLGMLILLLLRKKLIPQTTIFGKIAVASGMILFVFKPAALIFPVLAYATKFIEIGAGILIALSLADKGFFLIRGITQILAEHQGGSVEKNS